MYEGAGCDSHGTAVPCDAPSADGLATAEIAVFLTRLSTTPAAVAEAENIDRLRLLQELKAVCASAQVRETTALEETRRDAETARGVPAYRRCRGLGDEIGLARRESPWHGARWVSAARTLNHDLPGTLAALTRGAIPEARAMAVVRETAHLTPEQRREVDARLAGRLDQAGDRELVEATRSHAQAVDPRGAGERARVAEAGRYVTIATAAESMVHLSALLPKAEGIAAWKSLGQATKSLIASGETGGRSRDQMAADLFVARLTGQESAQAVPVEVHLVMTDTTLAGISQEPAWLVGHGPIPATAARDLLDPDRDDPSGKARVWWRRLYTRPEDGQLVAMDSMRRTFDGMLRRMVLLRDDTCRTPWCDAPIRHTDHAKSHASGGPTSYANASGLCERCNHTKENPGWSHTADPTRLDVTTPTGHAYHRETPPLLRGHPPGRAHPPVHRMTWTDLHRLLTG